MNPQVIQAAQAAYAAIKAILPDGTEIKLDSDGR